MTNLNAKFIESDAFKNFRVKISFLTKEFDGEIRAGDTVSYTRSTSYKNKRGKWKSEYVQFVAKIDYLSKTGGTAHGHLVKSAWQDDGWKTWLKGESVAFRTDDIDGRTLHETDNNLGEILAYAGAFAGVKLDHEDSENIAAALVEADKLDYLVFEDASKPRALKFKSKNAEKVALKLAKERTIRLQAEKEAAAVRREESRRAEDAKNQAIAEQNRQLSAMAASLTNTTIIEKSGQIIAA